MFHTRGRPKTLKLSDSSSGSASNASSNGTSNSSSKAPCFRPRSRRLNWRLISEADFDRVRDMKFDIDALETYLETLTFSDLDLDSRFADADFLKAFKFAQLLLEYFLYVQDSMLKKEKSYQSQVDELSRDKVYLEDRLRDAESHLIEDKNSLSGPMYCNVCREAFETIDVLTDEIHTLKGLLEAGKKRELQLHDRLDSLIQQQYEFVREKERMELEKKEQLFFFRKEMEDMRNWMQKELSFGQKYAYLQERMYSFPQNQQASFRPTEHPFASSTIQEKVMEESSKQKKLEDELARLKQQLQDVLSTKSSISPIAQVQATEPVPAFVQPTTVQQEIHRPKAPPHIQDTTEHKTDSQQVPATEVNDSKKLKSNPKLQILKMQQKQSAEPPEEEKEDSKKEDEEEMEEEDVPKSKPVLQVKVPSPRIFVSQPSPTTITELVDETQAMDTSKTEYSNKDEDSLLQDLDEKEIEFSSPSSSLPVSPNTLNVPPSPTYGNSTLSPSSPTTARRSPPARRRPRMMQIMSTK